MMGAERKSMAMKESEKRLTAYHEAGHAIVGPAVPSHDPVYKVSIIPRGRALGVTMFLPEEDRYSHSKEHLESQISSLFGGRIAEELIFGPQAVTTGASNDILRATDIARSMVTKWGCPTAWAAVPWRGRGRGVSRSLGDSSTRPFQTIPRTPSMKRCALSSTATTSVHRGF